MDWFATQVDRDFNNNYYGTGIRFYSKNFSELSYTEIEGISFEKNHLKVKDINGYEFTINTEPNNEMFKETLYKEWKNWDKINGKMMEDNRSDYEPFAIKSLAYLASVLGVHKNNSGESPYLFR